MKTCPFLVKSKIVKIYQQYLKILKLLKAWFSVNIAFKLRLNKLKFKFKVISFVKFYLFCKGLLKMLKGVVVVFQYISFFKPFEVNVDTN